MDTERVIMSEPEELKADMFKVMRIPKDRQKFEYELF